MAKRTTQTTFRARVTRSKTTQERLLTGYVNQFGPQDAAHLFVVPQLAPAPNVQRTLALYAEVHKSMIWYKEWQRWLSVKTVAEFNAEVSSCIALEAKDVWRIKTEGDKFSLMLRVQASDLVNWLQAPLPIVLAPVGESSAGFQIIWDRELQYVEEARQRFDSLPGYQGLATSRGGLGARIIASEHQAALNILGRAMGDIWLLTGFPLNSVDADAEHLLASLQWPAALLPGGRRARGKSAIYKVRAVDDPPNVALRMAIAQEVCQIHIVKANARNHTSDAARAQQPPDKPQSWAQ
eukprot:1661736-Amphidinium_carterae.1